MLQQPLAVEFTGQTSEGLPLVRVLRTLRFETVNEEGEDVLVDVPAGYVTDFASVPKWMRGVINPWHIKTLLAAILHDFLLEPFDAHGAALTPRADFDRKAIDRAFKAEMRKGGLSSAGRTIRYLGVRIGSKRAYDAARAI